MSTLRVTNLKGGSAGSAPNLPDGAVVTGVVTATSFSGSGANLTGIDATALKDGSGNVKIQANSDGAVVTGVLTAPTVSGTTGSFTGNVSVGGTLTYEDVTNVDSVGLITARGGVNISGSDLKVGAAFTVGQSGVVTATSFIGSGANLTNLPPAGNTVSLVADGAIAAGKPCIIQTDGKTKQVSVVYSNPSSAPSNSTEGTGSDVAYYGLCWSPQRNKAILANAKESGNKQGSGTVLTPALPFGTNSLTVGSDQPFDTSDTEWTDCVYDPDTNQIIFVWEDMGSSSYGDAVLGTLSGSGYDEMTYGTTVTFESSAIDSCKVTYDTANDKAVVIYRITSSGALRAVVGTISGTDISFGTAVELGGSVITDPGGIGDAIFDSVNNKVVVVYHHAGQGNRGYAAVLTVSGTSISWGTPVQFNGTNSCGQRRCCFDENVGKVVIAFQDGGNSQKGTAVVGTVSGTSMTFGSTQVYPSNITISGQAICYDPSSKDIFIFGCASSSSNHARIIRGTVSGTSITLPYATTLTGGQDPMHNDSNDWALIAMNTGNSVGEGAVSKIVGICRQVNVGTMKFYTFKTQTSTTNGTCNNIIGWSVTSYTNGQTATLKTVGNVIDNQSGLTPGTDYYIHGDGSLATTWDSTSFGSCATNANFGGTAIAADKLLIRDINAKF